jgi:lactam utilization protein B
MNFEIPFSELVLAGVQPEEVSALTGESLAQAAEAVLLARHTMGDSGALAVLNRLRERYQGDNIHIIDDTFPIA